MSTAKSPRADRLLFVAPLAGRLLAGQRVVQRRQEPLRFLSKQLSKLVAELPAEGFVKELGRECGLQPGKDLRKEPDPLSGKEPDKELAP